MQWYFYCENHFTDNFPNERRKTEEKNTSAWWIFYLYILLHGRVVYYCRVPDAWLYVPDFMWVLSLVDRVFSSFFSSLPCLFHTCNKNKSCHSKVVYDAILFRSFPWFVQFCFIWFHSISIGYGRRYDFIYHHIFWCVANMSSNVNRYGRVRLEIKLISKIPRLSIICSINQRANVAKNEQITFECKRYLVRHWHILLPRTMYIVHSILSINWYWMCMHRSKATINDENNNDEKKIQRRKKHQANRIKKTDFVFHCSCTAQHTQVNKCVR